MSIMANPGAHPLDPDSAVGQLRLMLGDTQSVPLVPPVTGQQDYTMFSDAELTQFLVQSEESLSNGAGYAYLQLAGQAALEAKNVATDDLRVSTEKRAELLRQLAKFWFDKGAEESDLAGGNDWFDVVPTGTDHWSGYEYFPVRS